MKQLLRPAVLTLALGTLLTGCESLSSLNPAASLTGGDAGADGGADQGQMMLDAMKDQPAVNMLAMAPDAKVGTWWEHSMAGGAMTMRYDVVAERGGQLVVEQAQDMGGTILINAFLVDPTVDVTAVPAPGEPTVSNVTKAWIGMEGAKPVERPVMEAMIMPEPTGDVPEVEFTEGMESVAMAGRDWDAKWMESSGSKTWMAPNSIFVLKSTMNGDVAMELSGMGTDAESRLDWTE